MHFTVTARPFRNQACCDCGWQSKNRWLRGVAVADAYLHGPEFGHMPADASIIAGGETNVMILKAS